MEVAMEISVNDSNFKKEVIESSMPVLVDFWASWCMPCLIVGPVIAKIAKKYEGKLKVCKANVDEAPQIASQYGIMSIPTVAIFKNGKIAHQTVGALPQERLEAEIEPFLIVSGKK